MDLSEQELIILGFLGESEPLHHCTYPPLTYDRLVDVAPGIKDIVERVRADPERLGSRSLHLLSVRLSSYALASFCFSAVTCFMVDCLKRRYSARAPPQGAPGSSTFPISPTISEAESLYSQLSNDSDALTVVAPDLISKYEINFWYHGISDNPPKLMWRSDIETNPFPVPAPGQKSFEVN